MLTDSGDKLDAAMKARLEEAQQTLREALNGDDTDAIRNASDGLARIAQEAGQALYAATADQPGAAGGGAYDGDAPADDDEDIVDAEIVDEGEDKGAA